MATMIEHKPYVILRLVDARNFEEYICRLDSTLDTLRACAEGEDKWSAVAAQRKTSPQETCREATDFASVHSTEMSHRLAVHVCPTHQSIYQSAEWSKVHGTWYAGC
ncbi:hypothetical protein M404DRAFT_994727 [Pisolithus tinctorius Marx 270]|uniref:Uncharacterized protein n=1 Tax=Pisolithus tinctorius Marx 270 TaxID=870435 RepID=A0A0C3PQ15_PISTI|nr:hypothetical protein M404DRAFT_994727 [Pisolithus tinctorius Marx 270]